MPNRLIKQIIAKLNGESTQETFDIYDDAALHAEDVIDDLVSENTDKPLSARQGKIVHDKVKSFYPSGWIANVDLNTLIDPGVYMLSTGITNYPVNNHPWSPMFVYGASGNVRQLLILTTNDTYVRSVDSGNWTSWTKLN